MTLHPDLDEVVRREKLLLDPVVRADPAAAGALLHPDFTEVGRSGRLWDRAAILAALAADPEVTPGHTDFTPERVTDDVVLLRFRSADGTRRATLWVRDRALGWVARYHQGTPPPVGES